MCSISLHFWFARSKLKGMVSLSTIYIIYVNIYIISPLNHHQRRKKKKKSRFYINLSKAFSHNLMLKNGICMLLVFPKKMIVQYKLNCSFARKLHTDCTKGNKNTKAILFRKERRELLFSKYSRM